MKNCIVIFLSSVLFVGLALGDTVYTPNGSAVTVFKWTPDLTSSQKSSVENDIAQTYPNATQLRGATRNYNCHSYAFYSQSSSNKYWMNTPNDDKYWQDGSYSYTNSPSNGAKASYVYGDHSGIKHSGRTLRSKWGQGPLMRHDYAYCPYWGGVNIINYYQ